jgi:hypothetical protein
MPKVKPRGCWVVVVTDHDTNKHITTRRIIARSAEAAFDKVCLWLDNEGFDFVARLEVGPDAEHHD